MHVASYKNGYVLVSHTRFSLNYRLSARSNAHGRSKSTQLETSLHVIQWLPTVPRMRYSKCNQATLFAASLARATIYDCYVASSGIRTRNRASYRVGDGLLWVLVAMATVKRGSSLCEGCGTSNGNRALVCKGCGKLILSTKTKRAKPQPVTTYSSNVNRLLDAELKTEIATAISVKCALRDQTTDVLQLKA